MTPRIEEFFIDGKNFVYYDLSNFKLLEEYEMFIEKAKLGIVKYPEHSLMTISNIANVQIDTHIKEALANWMLFNKPFVKCGVALGTTGIKKIILKAIFG
ncbi:MAG: hypothetical protein LBC63_02630, partial [Holophagales bacterium]|nr:hypothetical protein [Holophagales bacterium]